MLLSVVFGAICIAIFVYWLTRDPYSHIPGPSLWDLLWNNKFRYTELHLLLTELKGKYGPVFKLPQIADTPVVVLNDYESIHQAAVSEGKLFAGRPISCRIDTVSAKTGILFSYNSDAKWKSLRKTSQRHLRQFGDGLSRLESITFDIAEEMFAEFSRQSGNAYNPKRIMFDTALNTIAFLITGRRLATGDPIVEQMRQYESLFTKLMPVEVEFSIKIFDIFPWVRHFGTRSWKLFEDILDLESKIWQNAKQYHEDSPDTDSIYKVFGEQLSAENNTLLSTTDAKKSVVTLLFAGVATTSGSFYGFVNIMAHHKSVQNKIFEEINQIRAETGRNPCLTDKPNMHYTRAALLELGRYVSIVPLGVPHRNISDVNVRGLTIPANTQILLNQWVLHHDDHLWDKPFTFNPERFLDEAGQVVPADHPNRKHLMPFGAGPRVCLGETLAQTRLFIWLITTIQRFNITPAEGNEPSIIDPRNYAFEGIFRPTPYEVIFENRI